MIEGRWRLVSVLGQGGMGRVWKAHDARLDTHVALKELWLPSGLTPQEHEERLRRAEFEALSAARLRDHPRIVTVHDVVVADGRPWIVMQLVTGGTLHERLARGPLPPWAARRLAAALLDALEAAHRQDIVHRDVKPANVMVTGDRRILLTDFGIAASGTEPGAAGDATAAGAVLGSAPYLAPERVQGHRATPASDLFALGATLFEAVEGASPFARETPAASLHAAAYEDPPPPRRAGALTPLITALLAKDPKARPTVAAARSLLPPEAVVTDSEGPDLDGAEDGTGRRETPSGTRLLTSVHFPAPTVVTTATVEIRNKGSVAVRVLIAGQDRGTVDAGVTGTFRASAGVHSIQTRSRGEASDPRTFRLKPGATLRLVARRLGGKPVLEDARAAKKRKEKEQQARGKQPGGRRPAPAPKSPAKPSGSAPAKKTLSTPGAGPAKKPADTPVGGNSSSSEGGCALVVVGALLLGLLLYTQNAGFSSALSQYLNDPAAKADVGDCLLYGSWEKDNKPWREWVEVPCWSAAATHKVTGRLYGPARTDTGAGSTGSTGTTSSGSSSGTSSGTGLDSPASQGCALTAQRIVLSSVTLCATPEADG
ncbi:protein kinase domain-containing protein [Streptomyces axinellae]